MKKPIHLPALPKGDWRQREFFDVWVPRGAELAPEVTDHIRCNVVVSITHVVAGGPYTMYAL